MTLLEQCQVWHDNNDFQKIIDAIEAIPADRRTPELDSELARAYNNLAAPGDRKLYKKAIALLERHKEYFHGDYYWNFRMGYAYYYMDQEGTALHYFEQALEARPDDQDTQELMDNCRTILALPQFEKNFRERTEHAWAAFIEIEGTLRRIIDTDQSHKRGEELLEKCSNALGIALSEPAIEMGFNGEKYELILSPDGDRAKLFPLVYFQSHAPSSVLERWNILVGRQPSRGFDLQMDGWNLQSKDVQVWVDRQGEQGVALALYCEKLLLLLQKDEDKAWWMLSLLTDQVLGEVNAIAHICGFDVLDAPRAELSSALTELPKMLETMGRTLYRDAAEYLENSYLTYELGPVEDPDADWRMDIYVGATRLPALINDYMNHQSDTVDHYHKDGIVAGFFCYPLESFTGNNRGKKILDFREALQKAVEENAGEDAVTFLQGATGLYHGYLDFIAWDLPAVLQAATNFFQESPLPWAIFHSFRRDVGGVRLFNREQEKSEKEPKIDPQTGPLLSREDINALEEMEDGIAGYYGRMLTYITDFVKSGVKEGRFTEEQARRDLQIALWYAFACENLDQYEYYYQAAQWMADSEPNAKGCGTWYYRYSVALEYCGRLGEALQYAEQGTLEEPDYPWIWLQVGKLRAHFGDEMGALEATEYGLKLVPEDYEFLTLQREIQQGATLEQMEYHWINPDADRELQAGLAEDADDKQRAISCIITDEAGLERFMKLFHFNPADFTKDGPYCCFQYSIQGHSVELVFRMNEAGLSKLKGEWLQAQKMNLDSGRWLSFKAPGGEAGVLDTALFGLDYCVSLIYRVQNSEGLHFQVWLDNNGDPIQISSIESVVDREEAKDPSSGEIGPLEYYSEEEMEVVETHITDYFGPMENVFHELVSPDIHVDICLVDPTQERDYYTLVTMGMGAHRMHVPEELSEYHLERAELAIALPSNWKLDEDSLKDERWYWPIRLLKSLARLPISYDTWLGWGHTMDIKGSFADNTNLSGAILIAPQRVAEGGETCILPSGEEINFYQVIPLYREEMEYKQAHSAEELLDRMEEISFVVDPNRPNVIATGQMAGANPVMDDGEWHLESIREKSLPVEELAAYNHMAIYLRWCIEQNLMNLEFLERYWGELEEFKADPTGTDLRLFIREELAGQLFYSLFDEDGEEFAQYYYGNGDAPYFPSDIDDYALSYFGPARYHSDEFREEAYLFIPFDEDYYQAMAQVIQKRWDCWQNQEISQDTEPSQLARAMMRYLRCECQYFPPMRDDDPITAALGYAQRLGVQEGFVPMLVAVDETLWECLLMNADPDSKDAKEFAFAPDHVARYRQEVLTRPEQDGQAILHRLLRQRKEEAQEDGMDWEDAVLGKLAGGEENNCYLSYWDADTERTVPLILAKIPVKNPWEIFAWLPFGGWNECPDTPELMSIANYWYQRYGAVPAVMIHDQLEFTLPTPAPRARAMELAQEQYGFCPDVVDQGSGEATVGRLADTLWRSDKWYFWWD